MTAAPRSIAGTPLRGTRSHPLRATSWPVQPVAWSTITSLSWWHRWALWLLLPPRPVLQPQRCLCYAWSSLPTSVWYTGSQTRHWSCDVALECQTDGGLPPWDLTHPGMLLVVFATKVQCWLMFNLLSNKIQVLFCFLDSHLQPILLYKVIPSQGQGLVLTFAELHEVPIRHISSVCWSPSEQQPCPPAYWLLPPLDIICKVECALHPVLQSC